MNAKLVITGGDNETQEVLFDRPRITLGRKAGNDLHFNRPEISNSHAAFLLENDQFFVSDLGSTNGTLMNGARLLPNERYSLQNGDLITIAPYKIEFLCGEDLQDTLADEEDSGETISPSHKERDGSGTIYDMSTKLSTGTEEHKKAGADESPEKASSNAAIPDLPPPPPIPPPPEPVHKPKEEPTKPLSALEEEYVPIKVPKAGADYLWLGLGALFLLIAIGIIVFILTA